MRTKNYLSLFFTVVFSTVSAQQKLIDSLELQLKNPTNGLSKIEVLNELSWYYASIDATVGLQKADMAKELSLKNMDSLQLGIAYERKGYNYEQKGMDSITLIQYKKAERIYTLVKHQRRLATLNYNLGFFHMKRANYDQSIKHSNKAINVYWANNDTLKIARTLNQIGVSQLYLGDYTKSQNSFNEGLLLMENIGKDSTQFYAQILGNQGLLQEKLSHYQTALEFQQRALAIHKANKFISGTANTQNNMGKLYSILGDKEEALAYFKKSYELKKKIGNQYRIANVLSNMGKVYIDLNQTNKALETLNEAKDIYNRINHETNLSTIHRSIGRVHLENQKIKLAKKHFDSAVTYASNAKDKRALYLSKESLAEAAFKQEKFKKAYTLNKDAEGIRETMLSEEKRDELAQLKAKYEYDKEKAILEATFEKDKALSQSKIEQQVLARNTAIGGGILGMLAIAIGFVLVRRKREAELNTKLATSELQTLKAQLNPHFVFNTLNSINDYISKNEKTIASKYLTRFSMMMRQILDNSREEEITLTDELDFLKSYIELEQVRLDHKFNYSITVADGLNPNEILIPPALLQPFVENSILRGLYPKRGKDGHLDISITKKEQSLFCTIDDNGVGMKNNNLRINANGSKSFGSNSIVDRLDLLNKIKGDSSAKVSFIEKDQGIRVQVQLPLAIDSDV